MADLSGKTALVTGAANGIGRATVERLIADGASVVAVDLAVPKGVHHAHVAWVEADVTSTEALSAAAERANAFGRLDVCIANAGIGKVENFLDGTQASWHQIVDVNLIGVMVTLQAAARLMVADGGGGRLLATASIAGIRGEAQVSAYCATKGGVIALMRSLAIELAPHNITANAVAPGQVATDLNAADVAVISAREGIDPEAFMANILAQVPARRMARPEEIAGVFAFLASEDAAYISGATIRIDGGELAV